ncbi:MAG: iron-containing alcohol dehydrogenase [Candidatus Aenigmarchaeota archaeon]|nr:iron-containing alcohol dehydrogenase [Candidatus Aenigmarchaeota archaeon]
MIFNFPLSVLVEKTVEDKISSMLLNLDLGKKCIIFADDNVKKIIADRVAEAISGEFEVRMIKPESAEKNYIESLAKTVSHCDFSIAIGGGRTIDVAKYSSFLAGKPWIAFPTILSHDGVVSSRASIENDKMKISIQASGPAAIIADLETIKGAPYRFLASGCGDLISNISAVNDWKIASRAKKEKYSTLIAELSLLSAKACIEHVKEIKSKSYGGIEALLWGLVCSGFAMNLHGSSRPCSGSEHNFSHALEKLFHEKGLQPAMHGEQAALGTIISMYLQKGDWKGVKKSIRVFGLPTTAKQLGASADLVVEALMASRGVRDRYTILDKYKLTEKASRKILETVGII